MTENKSRDSDGFEKKGGYPAGPKTPRQVKPPPSAFSKPKGTPPAARRPS